MMAKHAFAASNAPGTCLWCGRKLRKTWKFQRYGKLGAYADGFFCGLSCAHPWAVTVAGFGHRLKPVKP